jgi:integrase
MHCHGRSVNSLGGFISGLAHYYRKLGLGDLPRGELFTDNMTGLKNIFGQIDAVAPSPPVDMDDLRALHAQLDFTKLDDVRFWCATLLGFFGLLRAGEFTASRLQWSDIEFHEWGVRVVVPFSKTDLTPSAVAIVFRGDFACLRTALLLLRSFYPLITGRTPVYPKSYNAFNSEFKRRCKCAGINKTGLTTHGLRRGGATALFDAGVSEVSIMAHGRWLSSAWRQYIEFGLVQQRVPTQMLLQHHCQQ